MPLLRKMPHALLEPPKDLEPNELVYQVRFTKEIFRDYQEYLNRINLYRQRTWTCKISGKSNLTYEEALVCEKSAAEKVQVIPKELVAPALRLIQFSMLSLKDLADTIASSLQEQLFMGMELQGRKNDSINPCTILRVVGEGTLKTQYEVAWLDKNKETIETSMVVQDDLIRRKLPLSRQVLKSFIRESTYRSAPWVLHEKLAKKHCIPSGLPEELKGKVFVVDGMVCNKKKKRNAEDRKTAPETEAEFGKVKKRKPEDDNPEEPINYPIDDLSVKPGPDDPVFTERPPLSRDFNVPMHCVGDLLMIWDFCSSFGRLLHLWPFSLEDFENAINHKDGHLSLIVEMHSALLRLLVKGNGEYSLVIQKRSRKLKITLINWTEYLCDFLEMINLPDLCTYITMIKRGHFSLLDAEAKVAILRELVNQAVATSLVREKLDDYIEQRHVLAATRREIALQEGRKKREEKGQLKAESVVDEVMDGHVVGSVDSDVNMCAAENEYHLNGEMVKRNHGQVSSHRNLASEKSGSNHSVSSLKLTGKKHIPDVEYLGESIKVIAKKEALRQLKDEKKEAAEKKTKEQRREYFAREIEKRVLRTNSLGKDRYYNRYWWFQRDGRIFVESSDSKTWGYYSSKDELDALMGSLNCKGERERALCIQLEKFHFRISSELQKRSKNSAEKISLEEAVLRRSTRVRAMPKEIQTSAFLRYVNKWKED